MVNANAHYASLLFKTRLREKFNSVMLMSFRWLRKKTSKSKYYWMENENRGIKVH